MLRIWDLFAALLYHVLVEKESNQDFKCSFILGFDHPLRKQNFWIGSLTLFLFYQVIIWLIFSKQIPKHLVLFEQPIYWSLFFFLYLLSFIFYLLCISILLIYCENRVFSIKIFLEFISLAFLRNFLLFLIYLSKVQSHSGVIFASVKMFPASPFLFVFWKQRSICFFCIWLDIKNKILKLFYNLQHCILLDFEWLWFFLQTLYCQKRK